MSLTGELIEVEMQECFVSHGSGPGNWWLIDWLILKAAANKNMCGLIFYRGDWCCFIVDTSA